MAVDVNSLTVENITPEIMAQMGPSEIAAFKAKLTPEQIQSLADKFGGSQVAPPEDAGATPVNANPSFVVSPAEVQQTAEANASAAAQAATTNKGAPSEQKGPITFGRK